MGADTAGKRDLPPGLHTPADLLLCDDVDAAGQVGELQHVDDATAARAVRWSSLVRDSENSNKLGDHSRRPLRNRCRRCGDHRRHVRERRLKVCRGAARAFFPRTWLRHRDTSPHRLNGQRGSTQAWPASFPVGFVGLRDPSRSAAGCYTAPRVRCVRSPARRVSECLGRHTHGALNGSHRMTSCDPNQESARRGQRERPRPFRRL